MLPLLGLVLAAAGLKFSHTKSTVPSTHPVTNTQVQSATKALPEILPAMRWVTGESSSWAVSVMLSLSDSAAPPPNGAGTHLDGHLHMIVLNVGPDQIQVALALSEVRLYQEQKRIAKAEDLMNKTPAIVNYSPEGKILSIAYPRNLAPEDRQFLRLAYGWEWVVDKHNYYETTEVAPEPESPIFACKYQRPTSTSLVKSRFLPANVGATQQTVLASNYHAQLGSLWLSEMTGTEQCCLYLNDKPYAYSHLQVSFTTSVRPLPEALRKLVGHQDEIASEFSVEADTAPPALISISEMLRLETLRERWGSASVETMLLSLQNVSQGSMAEATGPLHDLEDWLKVHPEGGPAIVTALRSLTEPEITGLLVHALSQAGCETGRAALIDVLTHPDEFPTTTVIQAAVAAGELGSQADQRVVSALTRLMDSTASEGGYDLADTAILAGARLAKDNPSFAQTLMQGLAESLQPSAHPRDTVLALLAFGNARLEHSELTNRALELTNAATSDLRAAALDYLGSLPARPAYDEALTKALHDEDLNVSRQAREILQNQDRPRSQIVQTALQLSQPEAPGTLQ